MNDFLAFSDKNSVLPLTRASCTISADIYAKLRKTGQPIGEIDILIAGTAIANDLMLITHNVRHFERIENLEIDDWSI